MSVRSHLWVSVLGRVGVGLMLQLSEKPENDGWCARPVPLARTLARLAVTVSLHLPPTRISDRLATYEADLEKSGRCSLDVRIISYPSRWRVYRVSYHASASRPS